MSASDKITPAPMTGSRRWADLGARTGSAIVLVIVALVTTRVGGVLFIGFWFAASFAVLWEWQRLIGTAAPWLRFVAGGLTLVVVALCVSRLETALALFTLAIGAAVIGVLAAPGKRLWAASGMIYAGLLLIAVVLLRQSFPFGIRAIVWLFATVWATDCFAYFGGRLIGGPKLWPRISPSKTWSGTLVGVVSGGLIGTAVALYGLPGLGGVMALRGLPEPWGSGAILTLSFAAAALSQCGDALESGIKRHFGVKDSSRLIPGHGGVMDRLDGFVAAAVFAFLIGLIRNGPSIAGGLFYWV